MCLNLVCGICRVACIPAALIKYSESGSNGRLPAGHFFFQFTCGLTVLFGSMYPYISFVMTDRHNTVLQLN